MYSSRYKNQEKPYGTHKYSASGTSDCAYKCGCHCGDSSSDGPLGLDPLPGGLCPGNPKDKKPLGGKLDYEAVVNQRINGLERALAKSQDQLKKVAPSKKKLAERLEKSEEELSDAKKRLGEFKALAGLPT